MPTTGPLRNAPDSEFLLWLRDRLVNIYEVSPNTDYVRRLEKIAEYLKQIEQAGTD